MQLSIREIWGLCWLFESGIGSLTVWSWFQSQWLLSLQEETEPRWRLRNRERMNRCSDGLQIKRTLDESSELTENGVDLVRVKCAALRLEGRSATSSTSQVAVHQRVHIKHAHQQRPCHCRGRLCLISCLPRADVTENTRTRIHLHLAHLDRWKPGEINPSLQGYVSDKMVNQKVTSLSMGPWIHYIISLLLSTILLTCPLMFPAVHWLSEQLLLSSSMLVWLQSGASSPMWLPSPRSPGISSSSEPSGPQDSKMSPLRSSWSCWLLTWGRSSTSWLVECCWCKYGA